MITIVPGLFLGSGMSSKISCIKGLVPMLQYAEVGLWESDWIMTALMALWEVVEILGDGPS